MVTTYTTQQLNDAIEAAKKRKEGHYKKVDTWLHQALDAHTIDFDDVLIVGSCEQGFGPWYEGIALERDAYVYSTDYNYIDYEDSQRVIFLDYPIKPGTYTFGNIICISSIEHSGLGRYGDIIDPDADLKEMERLMNILCNYGLLFLAVPLGKDKVVGNLHRIYGRQRLPLLLKGWKMIDSFGYEEDRLDIDTGLGWDETHPEYPEYSPVLVLEKV